MAVLKYDAIAKAGTYKAADGTEKTRFHKCGVVFESAKGLSLKLESLPIGFDGWLNLSPPRPKDGATPAKQTPAKTAPVTDGFEDSDAPF